MCCYGVLNLIAKHGRLFNRGILFVDKEDTELEKGGTTSDGQMEKWLEWKECRSGGWYGWGEWSLKY